MLRIIFLLTFLCLAQLYAASQSLSDQKTQSVLIEKKNVLVLHSYSENFEWTNDIMHALKDRLDDSNLAIDLYVEYLDTKRFPDRAYWQHLIDAFKTKYQTTPINLIITSDNNALEFLFQHRDRFYPKVPVVFCGLNNFKPEMLENQKNITGIAESTNLKETLDLALSLHPNTKKLIFIASSARSSTLNLKQLEEIRPRLKSSLTIEIWKNKPIEEIEKQAHQLKADSLLFIIGRSRDMKGEYLNTVQMGRRVSTASTAPVYSLWNFYLGTGIVGGKLVYGRDQGRVTGDLALMVLKGIPVDDIPVIIETPTSYMFDYLQLKRFGITLDDLPKSSIVINKPYSFYEANKKIVWITVIVFCMLTTLVIFLFLNVLRRQRAEKELQKHQDHLEDLVEERTVELSVANKALRESEARFKRASDNSPAVLYQVMMAPGGEISFPYMSDVIVATMGVTPEEVMKDPSKLLGMVHPEDKEMFQEGIMKSAESLESFPLTFRCMKDGEVIWIEARGMPTPLADGGILWDGFLLDITESKQAEEALRESEERFRIAGKAAYDLIYEWDVASNALEWFGDVDRLLGYRKGEISRDINAWLDLINPEDRVKLENAVELHKTSTESIQYEYRVRHKDGTYRHWNDHGLPLLDDKGCPYKWVGVCTDISDRIQTEEEKKNLESQLHRAQKMEAMGLMAGGVAHDLNNILSGVVSLPELLLINLPEDSPLRKPIKTIQESGMRAANVVEDLMTIATGVASSKEPLNLNTMVEEYLKSAEHLKLERTHSFVSFKTELDPTLLNMNGSPTHIKKILMNLIANASEAIEGSGTVTISTLSQYLDMPLKGYEDVRTGEYTMLAVSDDGSGISPQDLERVFEPFYTKKVMGRAGTGLGLAVVWNTTQDYNGYINVNSSEKGTTFELYFPVTREEVAAEGEEVPLKDYLGHGERILVVDDDETQREIASGMLTKLGYKSESVSSGEDAIEYMKEHSVDLIVLDMVMPKGINGRKTYEEIIKIRPGQKAIIASGHAQSKEVDIAQELGAGKYVKKPYILEKIGVAVKEELGK